MSRWRRMMLIGGVIFLLARSAPACPVCDRETGRQVRAGIFDEDFGFNLAATLLPFGIFLGITAVIHGGFPRRAVRPQADEHQQTYNLTRSLSGR